MSRISSYFSELVHDYINWLRLHAVSIVVIVLVLMGGGLVIWPHSVHIIPAGHLGVLYKRLGGGTDLDNVYQEGLTLTLPWNQMTIYTSQVQQKTTDIEVLTSDRLKSKMTISFQYVAYPFNLPLLHKFVGPDYYEKTILPIIEAQARESVAQYSSVDAFTKDIQKISQTISLDTSDVILKKITPIGLTDVRLLTISDVQVTKFSFPGDLEAALQQKAVELVKSEAYQYRLVTEKLEAERKRIEAAGIRDFQSIADNALTENYLRYKGIEASANLAASPNSKVLIFGSGSSGLPLIMGGSEVLRDTPLKSVR
ncbi:prohibitin family protein [Alcaligenaceae bacterium LF4-65]|jgi:regulator of protease activity HflC (stomatin/prohibitin superfamily)|uniref:Prohibitin family protein n=1 Tax=Zwartia hollandica TaxID=324606 RepID=A0A953T5F4_9BURK|nr:prohibitin family protein [Zwartia hollandica]MBZ1350827.1 prohibitin family protein [Zwartia hollandica]